MLHRESSVPRRRSAVRQFGSWAGGLLRRLALLGALTLVAVSPASTQALAEFEAVDLPVGDGARDPGLYASPDDRLYMIWTEVSGDSAEVLTAFLEDSALSAPRQVVASADLFVNWADTPSITALDGGTLAAHWLKKSGRSAYSYDVQIAFSGNDGMTWSDPVVPHRDGTDSQHGFVSLLPVEDRVVAVWLDGRAYDGGLLEADSVEGAMQLRTATLDPDGTMSDDVPLDFMTCSCCQTAATVSGGAVVVAYRDRTEDEIRDISVVRRTEAGWSVPIPVHEDGWEISGCPVNGPAIAARDEHLVVAWFSGRNDIPAVRVAFSNDAGKSFGQAVQIDLGRPIGRVDALMLEDKTPLVSWVEWTGSEEVLVVCEITPEGCLGAREVAIKSSDGSVNFPELAATSDAIYLAWTQPLDGGVDTIRMLRAPR